MRLALQAVPTGIDVNEVKRCLESRPGVVAVHDIHVWAMSTTRTALTAHLVKPDGKLDDDLMQKISHELEHRFQIQHVTVQWEQGHNECGCKQEPDDVI
jgi:cobalt-zinc-cadmium efflux system protein